MKKILRSVLNFNGIYCRINGFLSNVKMKIKIRFKNYFGIDMMWSRNWIWWSVIWGSWNYYIWSGDGDCGRIVRISNECYRNECDPKARIIACVYFFL